MPSLSKILLTVAVIAVVYFVSRALSKRSAAAVRPPEPEPPAPRAPDSLDLQPCPVCGAYRPAGETCCKS